ncbi:MAG TPA: efflux transporter outer membrane subunit [Acidocella sp.]|uniref:efflux transporter outer membrane subunit n=1 Tax=Acidocella sp. TaxID=50710 RepID=UPI002BFC9C77|nr:efflux transporter outer membrane subunit [Acidocella sp.]HVE21196.1 efflux transporter outer membrane subunit [Acidocella sp.]
MAGDFRWGAVALLVTLAGCSLAPNYVPPSLTTPVAYTNMGPWTPASPADTKSRGAWWLIYDDATLSRLETELDASNPTLAIALSRYDQAQQAVNQAEAAEYPQIDVFASGTQNRQSDHRPLRVNGPDYYENDLLQGSFSYELDLWGRVRNTVAAGKDEAQATKDDAASVQLSLEATLADAYFNLRGLDAQEALLTKTVAAYARALQLTQAQHGGGIVSGLDVGQAQTQYDTAQAQLTDVIAARALFQNAIASLVGVPAPSFSLPPNSALPLPPAIPVAAPSVLLERRPDVAAAERRAAEANAQIGVARAAFFPTVSIDASGGFESDGGGVNLLNLSNSMWSLGPSLALTVFDGGFRKAAVKIAVDQFNQASEAYRATALTAFQEVENELALCNDLAVEAAQQNAAVAAADHTLSLSLDLYTEGAVTYLNVVTSQTADLDAQSAALAVATRRLVSSVDLVRALGGGWKG